VHPFEVAYEPSHPDLPAIDTWFDVPFVLAQLDEGWTAPQMGLPSQQRTLRLLNESPPAAYTDQALLVIATALSDVLLGQGLQGVSVAPDPRQLVTLGPEAGTDLRNGNTMLRLVLRVGRVTEMRTIASGDRVPTQERFNHPLHAHVIDGSPIDQPGDGDKAPGGLIRASALQDYLHRLSRHPNRSVEASVAAASQPGGVAMDYIITESNPWTAWYRFGNDGTRSEGYLRQQFGYHNSQLTENDDILSLLYATSNFSNTNSVNGFYDLPAGWDGRLRARVSGSWSQYFADQFGVSVIDDAFSGISWAGSGELRANVYQDGPLFIDAIGGVRYQFLNVSNNSIPGLPMFEQAGFVIPYGILRLEQLGAFSAVQASIGVEGSVNSHGDLSGLGRFDPADRWARLNWSATASTFLEPLLDAQAWRDPSTPASSTLAHELAVNFSGQWSMGNRLLPQFQQITGGPSSNRGYPVSYVAGDSAVLISGEYRFHLPRALSPNPQPGELFGEPFRATRQYVFGRPDWDLVPLAFVDASWIFQEGNQAFELNNTLISAGVGLEVVFRTNFRARIDWGLALTDVYGPTPFGGKSVIYESGKNRLYGSFTIYF
jgi:hemolysin activation/secretion protein